MKKNKKKIIAVCLAGAILSSTMIVNAATETGKRMYGDVDQNGRVDLSDLITMCRYAIKDIEFDEETLQVADVTKDGEVNVGDIALLKQYLMGDNIPIIGTFLEVEETTQEVTTVSETIIEETSITEVSETGVETTVTEVTSESISETSVETTVTEITSENSSEITQITTEDTTISSDVTTVTTPITTTPITTVTTTKTTTTTTTPVTTTTKPQTTTTVTTTSAPPVTTTVQTTPIDTSSWKLTIQEIEDSAKLINSIRANKGAGELKIDYTLCAAANQRAKELTISFEANRPDGSSYRTVYEEFGANYNTRGYISGKGHSSYSVFINYFSQSSTLLDNRFVAFGIGYDSNGKTWSILLGR